MRLTKYELATIDKTIRTVAQAEALRYFKAELNNSEYGAYVYMAIDAAIRVSLYQAGISFDQIKRVDPVAEITEAMVMAGYAVDGDAAGSGSYATREDLTPINDGGLQ